MTDLRQAAQQALERLRKYHHGNGFADDAECIASLEAALAQEQAEPVQEPVAWRYQDARGNYRYRGYVQGFDKEYSRLKPVPLYTAPPQRVPLSEEEAAKACSSARFGSLMQIVRAVERAHGIGDSK